MNINGVAIAAKASDINAHHSSVHFSLNCLFALCAHQRQRRSQDKAHKRHDNVMRLLVRRYITAEQRKRDDFGITEDDVMEIRQDISTLRFELIDIFNSNGMKTPNVNPDDKQCTGRTLFGFISRIISISSACVI